MRVFTTKGVPEQEQLGYWKGIIAEILGPDWHFEERDEAQRGKPFPARLEIKSQGRVVITSVQSPTLRAVRSREAIARSNGEHYYLSLQSTGRSHFRQNRRETAVQAGQVVIVDSNHPTEALFEPVRQIFFAIPQIAMRPFLAGRTVPPLGVIDPAGPVGRLFAFYVRSLQQATRRGKGSMPDGLLENFLGLLALALDVPQEKREEVREILRQARREAIREHALRHLADPALTPGIVARACGISTRYLHKLFEEVCEPFSEWLWSERVERCRQDLCDATQAHRTITDIALSWGFNDLSHFDRRFQAAYGVSPRDMRFTHKTRHAADATASGASASSPSTSRLSGPGL